MPCRRKLRYAFLLVLVSLFSCVRHDPQAVFDHAQEIFQRGDLARAQTEAEKGYDKFHSSSPEWAWKFRLLQAKILYWRGFNDSALSVLASELAPLSSVDLLVQKKRIESLSLPLPEAEGRLREAEKLCTGSDSNACADIVGARGTLEMRRGHFGEGQRFFEKALELARKRGDRFRESSALLNVSYSALEQTHFDEALDRSDASYRLSTSQGYKDLAQTALGNMGWAYYKLGDTEKAEGMFIEARKEAELLGDETDQISWLTNAGYIYLDARNFQTAQQSFQRSLDLATKISSREDIITALQALAFVSEQTNKLDDAKRYADEALAKAREDKNGRDQVYPLLVQGRVAARLHDAATAEKAFHEVEQSPDTPVFLKWEAERSLAHLHQDEGQFESADREYRSALATFETARAELQHEDSRLPFLTNAARIYDDYLGFLVTQNRAAEALQVADFSRARTLAEGLGFLHKGTSFDPPAINAQQIARGAGGTVLFYWLGVTQSYLWAITPQKIGLLQLPPESEIKTRVERYRKAIIDQRESSPAAADDGAALYRILVEPAKDFLPKDLKSGKVFVVPDGSLNGLNFETLQVPGPQPHYWIEDVMLSSAGSLRMLQAFHDTHQKGGGRLLLFGDAISPNEDFPALPKAAAEMENIKKHFPASQQQVFSREHASPPAYLASKPERFSYIHFVAHGTASRLSPLDSAIVLSKATAEDDSAKLYARDIIQHPLQAELVTISTCRSAGMRAYSGEGLVGLSWAFVRAGAHNVIGALWDVSDASTPQLMDLFYEEMSHGATPDAALRTAKLAILRSSPFRNPFYCAPFQLYRG